MAPALLSDIFGKKADYFHFAASLKYSEKSKDEIFRTNINGLENSIDVFQKYASENSRFFFISTAYSCGNITERFEEKFYENEHIDGFRNYYEQSKRFAESIIKKHIENHGLNAHIIRPSQVVGNNKTGLTKTDFGIFDFTKRVANLSNRYPNETIRIKANPKSTQNLIPIDTIVEYLMQVLTKEELPLILNFVAKQPVKNSDIIDCICDILPIQIITDNQLKKENMTSVERLMDIGMSFTGGYCSTNIQFDTKNLDQLGSTNGAEITDKSLRKMIGNFINNFIEKKQLHEVIV